MSTGVCFCQQSFYSIDNILFTNTLSPAFQASDAGRGLLTLEQTVSDLEVMPLSHPWLIPAVLAVSLVILYWLCCCRKRTRSRRSVFLSKLPVV